MKRLTLRVVLSLGVSFVVLAPAARAQGQLNISQLEQRVQAKQKAIKHDSKAKKALFKKAQNLSSFCEHCHGADGNSTVDEIPRLAGQNPVYLLDQIERFATGKRKDYIMTGLAGQLTDDEKVTLAVYYASCKPHKRTTDLAPPEVIAEGRKKYKSICFVCHGKDGKGTEGYARIAGQHERYIIHTLTNFKDGTGGRTSQAMSGVASHLTNADITGLAAYIHNMD